MDVSAQIYHVAIVLFYGLECVESVVSRSSLCIEASKPLEGAMQHSLWVSSLLHSIMPKQEVSPNRCRTRLMTSLLTCSTSLALAKTEKGSLCYEGSEPGIGSNSMMKLGADQQAWVHDEWKKVKLSHCRQVGRMNIDIVERKAHVFPDRLHV